MEKNKVISIVNQKGGVGKTTTALNMGAWLSIYAKAKVLLIDIDGQANLTACVNIDNKKIKGSTFDLLTKLSKLSDESLKDLALGLLDKINFNE